jgi:hypothetical protein
MTVGTVVRFAGSGEQFGELARTLAAQRLAAVDDPNGDAAPVLVAHRIVDGRAVVVPLAGRWFDGLAAKKALGRRVLTPLAAGGADYVALVTMTWEVTSDTPAGREVERLRAAGRPIPRFDELGLDGVEEAMTAWVATRDHGSVLWRALVSRSVIARPTAGSWEMAQTVESHWLDALQLGWESHV